MKTSVIGLFEQASQARLSIEELESQGVNGDQISMITSDSVDKKGFKVTENTKFPESAGAGAATGGALGLILGGLTAVGSVPSGGLSLLASGPIIASLTAGAAGAYGGGVLGAVIGTVIPDSEYQATLDKIEKGSVLLCIECQTEMEENVIKILEFHNAEHVQAIDPRKLDALKQSNSA